MRLDKWLWCARFYKTRGLAVEEIHKGRVSVNGQPAKPAREVRPGDTVLLRQGPVVREVVVRALSNQRVARRLRRSNSMKKPRKASPPGRKPPSSAASPPSLPPASAKAARPSASAAIWSSCAVGATAGVHRSTADCF
jgi:Ribosome-associated heat shock protein implicated in the recycling of the 50S subunit (S4 paralog)